MGGPLVSVIIPAYNRSALVREAIASALAQSYTPLEVVVVDDGSSDDTAEAIAKYGDSITLIRHDRNRGAPAARNTGIRAARGEYLAFLDADDLWEPSKLEKQMAVLLQRGDWGFCFCDYSVWRGGELVSKAARSRAASNASERPFEALLSANFVTSGAIVAPRERIEAIGLWDEALAACQDWDLALRLSMRWPVAYVDEPLVRIRQQRDSISADAERVRRSALVVLKKAMSATEEFAPHRMPHVKKRCARSLLAFGRQLFYEGDPRARQFLHSSLELSRWPNSAWWYLLASALPGRLQTGLRRGHQRRRERREVARRMEKK